MKKLSPKAIKIFLTIDVVILFILMLIFLVPQAINFWHLNFANEYVIGSGDSMEPTFHNGDKLEFNKYIEPKINDFIVFECFSKCDEESKKDTLLKRVVDIKKDYYGNICFWVEGDNKEISLDSRYFDWICEDLDIEVLGVVVENS